MSGSRCPAGRLPLRVVLRSLTLSGVSTLLLALSSPTLAQSDSAATREAAGVRAILAAAATAPAVPAALNPNRLGPAPHPHFLPVRTPAFFKAPIVAPVGAHLTYYGGNLLQNVQVVQVLWGSGAYLPQISGSTAPNMRSFFGNLVASSYLDWLGEYDVTAAVVAPASQRVGRGSFAGSYQISPQLANNAATITDAQIQTELASQIGAGTLPIPGPNTYYAIFFPHGHTITEGGTTSCVSGGFCAYHGTFVRNGANVRYAVHPDMQAGSGCDTGCGSGTPFGNATAVASHELAEAVTDPDIGLATILAPPLSWYDNTNGEIGDICNAGQGVLVGTDGYSYTVQEEFSNALGICVVSNPAVLAPDFAIQAAATQLTLSPGGSLQDSITLSLLRGAPLAVDVSITGLPAGLAATLASTSVIAPGSVALQLSATASAAPGTYPVTVTSNSGAIVHSSRLTVTVASAQTDAGDVPTLPQWAMLLLVSGMLGVLASQRRPAAG